MIIAQLFKFLICTFEFLLVMFKIINWISLLLYLSCCKIKNALTHTHWYYLKTGGVPKTLLSIYDGHTHTHNATTRQAFSFRDFNDRLKIAVDSTVFFYWAMPWLTCILDDLTIYYVLCRINAFFYKHTKFFKLDAAKHLISLKARFHYKRWREYSLFFYCFSQRLSVEKHKKFNNQTRNNSTNASSRNGL